MKRNQHYNTSSDSDDDIPINKLKRNGSMEENDDSEIITSKDLLKYSMETCKLCYRIFHTKYDLYLHHTKHIVIETKRCPILKCRKCKQHFLTKTDLKIHTCTRKESGRIVKASIKDIENDFGLKFKNELNKEGRSDCKRNIVRNSSIVKCEDLNRKTPEPDIKTNGKDVKSAKPTSKTKTNKDITKLNKVSEIEMTLERLDKIASIVKAEAVSRSDNTKRFQKESTIVISDIDTDEDNIKDVVKSESMATLKLVEEYEPEIVTPDSTTNIETPAKRPSESEKSESSNEIPDLFKNNNTAIKSKLIFEDDSDDDDLFTTNFIDLNNIYTEKDAHIPEGFMEEEKGEMVLGKIMLGSRTENSTASVHYDDLVTPRLYFCSHCNKSFPNRYKTIIHEMSHIKIRTRHPLVCHICDRCIAGNYRTVRAHIKMKHPSHLDLDYNKAASNICQKCGLKYYHYSKHASIYHYIYSCPICLKKFDNEGDRDDHYEQEKASGIQPEKNIDFNTAKECHEPKCDQKDAKAVYEDCKMKKFCEMCYIFLKNTAGIRHVYVSNHSKAGERQICANCEKDFYEVKLVKVLRKKVERKGEWKKCEKTNENRLKNIKNRLKMLNKLTRF